MNDNNGFDASTFYGEIEEIKDERFKQMKNFDIISDPPFDHHFIDYKRPINHILESSTLTQKIQQEWKILERNLPNSILVRVYENRIDLMRAVIIGPPDTPYYNGPFFFDILFPLNYPARQPKLFYHSHGLNLNSNLHPEGKDLYEPSGVLVWMPLPRLVLKAEPYINDPIRQYIVHESGVFKYNKNAFVSTHEAMIRTLKQPPQHFEDFVAGHFTQSAHPILMNYKEHMEESESMTGLFPKLIQAFEANGAYCKHHLVHVRKQKESTEQRSRIGGLFTRVLNKLKDLVDSLT
ncbi:putative ubiquitin-conjugating enzyme E2 23 [Sarracenia purpurea var. burkii]